MTPLSSGGDWICAKPEHWICKDTGMKKGDRVPGLIGWEYGQRLRSSHVGFSSRRTRVIFKNRIPPFPAERLEAISKVLADTETGLTGSPIDHQLWNSNLPNPTPDMTKWVRLYYAFMEFQNEHQVGNHVIVFIKPALDPARYVEEPAVFRFRRDRLNAMLAFCGYAVGEAGRCTGPTPPGPSTKPLSGPSTTASPSTRRLGQVLPAPPRAASHAPRTSGRPERRLT